MTAVIRKDYAPSKNESKFADSEDPKLPFKIMGTFWSILIALAIAMTSILLTSHRHSVSSPSQRPPNMLIEGSKF